MERREKIILIISILSGLLAALLIFGEIKQLKAKSNMGKKVTIIVSKKKIYPGEVIKREDLIYSVLPARFFSNSFIKRGDEVMIVGAIARNEIEPYRPISRCQIIPYGGKDYYISKIPEGYTPLTLTLDPDLQVGGRVRRGSRIDIYLFTEKGGGMLIPLVGKVKVVWIEQRGGKVELTLSLSEKDLYKVMMARSRGMLWVFPSRGKLPSKPISWNQLMGFEKRRKLPGIQILRGK